MRLLLISFLIALSACSTKQEQSILPTIKSEAVKEAIAIGQHNSTSAFTYVGVALFAGGAIVMVMLSKTSGLKLMGCGILAGSIPYILQSPYFSIIVSGALLLSLLIAIYHLWWKVKEIEKDDDAEKKP
jgi:hypothetical protein